MHRKVLKNCTENQQTSSYLIQRVVGGDGDGVRVHHQSLPQQREQAMCVHDLHLPPARWGKHVQPVSQRFILWQSDLSLIAANHHDVILADRVRGPVTNHGSRGENQQEKAPPESPGGSVRMAADD